MFDFINEFLLLAVLPTGAVNHPNEVAQVETRSEELSVVDHHSFAELSQENTQPQPGSSSLLEHKPTPLVLEEPQPFLVLEEPKPSVLDESSAKESTPKRFHHRISTPSTIYYTPPSKW